MQGGWQPPPGGGGGGYGPPGYGQPPPPQTSFGPPAGYAPQGYGAPPPMGGPPMESYGQYEFNAFENSVIDKCAGRAKLWGTISTVMGALQVLGSCGMVSNSSLATWLPSGIVAIVVGVSFIGVGNSLRAVVTSQGNDVMHMMTALNKLGGAFMVQIICMIVYVVLAILGVLLLMFVFAAAAAAS